ncbi:MAG: cupin domain-containing protein [Chitinophagaceae bacterium]
MAFKNKLISNPKTGQDIKFLQTAKDTDGRLLEMEATYNSHSKEPAAHYHPFQVEDFTILSGELTVRIDGQLKILKQGDMLHIPVNKVHAMWNNTDGITIVNWKVKPAMNTDNFLETATGLAIDGKTNKEGMPDILQVALMANKYSGVFRLSKPPFAIQKIVFVFLTPFAYLFGYRPMYKKYFD